MKLTDEELLKLYQEDLADRQKLLQLKLTQEKLLANDAKRRALVEDIIPKLNPIPRNYRDYFHAAAIFHRGEALSDQKKAYGYAKKAYDIAKLQQNDFANQVKMLYKSVCKQLKMLGQPNHEALKSTPRPNLTPMGEKTKPKKEKEDAQRINKPVLCPICRRPHTGICPPKPK